MEVGLNTLNTFLYLGNLRVFLKVGMLGNELLDSHGRKGRIVFLSFVNINET